VTRWRDASPRQLTVFAAVWVALIVPLLFRQWWLSVLLLGAGWLVPDAKVRRVVPEARERPELVRLVVGFGLLGVAFALFALQVADI
jgi:hypothetical protein